MSIRLNRRHWLQRSTAVAAAGLAASAWPIPASPGPSAWGQDDPAPQAQKPLKIQKALKYHMITAKLSDADKIKLAHDLGFDGVEPHMRQRDQYDRAEMRKTAEAVGIRIHGVINSNNPDIVSAIDMARYFGGTSVLVVAGRVNKNAPYDEVYKSTQEIIRRAIDHAEKHQIKILIENVWNNFLLSPLEMARYIDELDSPMVGAYFDVGNVVRFGWPEHWIHILGERIGKLDIKEYSREKQLNEGLRKGFQVELGEGDCDWPAVRSALRDTGYSGWATAEVPGGDRERLADIARRMDHILT